MRFPQGQDVIPRPSAPHHPRLVRHPIYSFDHVQNLPARYPNQVGPPYSRHSVFVHPFERSLTRLTSIWPLLPPGLPTFPLSGSRRAASGSRYPHSSDFADSICVIHSHINTSVVYANLIHTLTDCLLQKQGPGMEDRRRDRPGRGPPDQSRFHQCLQRPGC